MHQLQDIWTELGERVRRFVATRVRDSHAADDISQDVMFKVQTHLEELGEGQKLESWIFSVARNAIIDYYRSRAVRDHTDISAADQVIENNDAGEQSAARELSACLTRMIEQLPEPYREAMKLADVEGLNQQQIADRAGISLSGAKSRVQRAREMMRQMLTDCCAVEQDARGNVVDYHSTPRTGKYCGGDGKPCGG
jgi:RNA polymerase sigma-70 factor, ECF subfamily